MTVFLGLGSNIPNRLAYLRQALLCLGQLPGTKVFAVSRVYETSPLGPRQRDFLNAAVKISTKLKPQALLSQLKGIEKCLGRKPRQHWGPREIDLDILFYGQLKMKSKSLVLPHPGVSQRKFVLKPLSDIAPHWKDPLTGHKVTQLLAQLTDPNQSVRLYSKSLSHRKIK